MNECVVEISLTQSQQISPDSADTKPTYNILMDFLFNICFQIKILGSSSLVKLLNLCFTSSLFPKGTS